MYLNLTIMLKQARAVFGRGPSRPISTVLSARARSFSHWPFLAMTVTFEVSLALAIFVFGSLSLINEFRY